MIFGWIFVWGIIWLLIVLAGPFVAYLEAGDRARRKYEGVREDDEERMRFLKSIYMGTHEVPQHLLPPKPVKLSRRKQKRLAMKAKKKAEKERKRLENHST